MVEGGAKASAAGEDYGSPAYRWYALFVLILVFACHAMDRGLPGVLVEPIKADFGLKDSQIGLITSSSYGIAFALAVVPMGMLSDRLNRRNLLAVLLIGWSLCTALGGFARNFWQLAAARIGVGIAESGGMPISMPMVTDMFPARSRTTAIGIYYINSSLGAFLAGALGGWVAQHYGWRIAFMLVGAPGVLLAILLLLTVREPRRGGYEAPVDVEKEPAPPLSEVIAFLLRSPGFLCIIVGSALVSLVSVASGMWAGSFFIRIHHLSLTEVGLILGLGGGLFGAFAPPISGYIADRLAGRDERWTLRVVWISLLVSLSAGLVMLFSPLVALSIAGYMLMDFFRSSFAALTFAELMGHSPVRMRGTIMSFIQMMSVFMAFGVGPALVGVLSDLHGGGAAIRYALRDAVMLLLVSVALYIVGSRFLYGRRVRPA